MTERRPQLVANEVCSVAQTLEIIGERWTMLVLREAFFGTKRFEDFRAHTGCARNILSDRLQKLVEKGILERWRYQERPPRSEYRLTAKGGDLYPVLVTLMQWGDRHLADERGPAIVLDHIDCGHETSPELVCSHCGKRVHIKNTRARKGAGAVAAAG